MSVLAAWVAQAGDAADVLSDWGNRDFSAPCAATDLRGSSGHLFVLGGWDDDANIPLDVGAASTQRGSDRPRWSEASEAAEAMTPLSECGFGGHVHGDGTLWLWAAVRRWRRGARCMRRSSSCVNLGARGGGERWQYDRAEVWPCSADARSTLHTRGAATAAPTSDRTVETFDTTGRATITLPSPHLTPTLTPTLTLTPDLNPTTRRAPSIHAARDGAPCRARRRRGAGRMPVRDPT